MLSHHGRYQYSPIVNRPDYCWPDSKRLAVYIALNLEHFAFGEGLGAKLVPSLSQPDVLNYAWRDYGNRVGVWRLLELFDDLHFPVALLVNSEIYDYCPEVIDGFRNRGDEIIAHGRTNSEQQGALSEEKERILIEETTKIITHYEKKPPTGWLGPWIAESRQTPDLLQAAGYQYLLDWCCDDQPIWFKTQSGRILSIPYPQEINDIPTIGVRGASAAEFADMIIDNFDEMRDQAQHQSLVFGIALHPYIVGQPFRLKHLRRALKYIAQYTIQGSDIIWLTHPGAIAQYVQNLPAGVVP
ncbi:MAG: polysaccharide deacetylase family protein [Leptolyngbyaceae cyanobacterium MO_188.B28]|nr:polysaccharide deacetylase family protein [Leptolyngbyaceae cyanobacterium MO_188.B28]